MFGACHPTVLLGLHNKTCHMVGQIRPNTNGNVVSQNFIMYVSIWDDVLTAPALRRTYVSVQKAVIVSESRISYAGG